MANSELFEKHYQAFVATLPMKSVSFLAQLEEHSLLPTDIMDMLDSMKTSAERASYFLDTMIKPEISDSSNEGFNMLLRVMRKSNYDHVKDLAFKIKPVLFETSQLDSVFMNSKCMICCVHYSTFTKTAKPHSKVYSLYVLLAGLKQEKTG